MESFDSVHVCGWKGGWALRTGSGGVSDASWRNIWNWPHGKVHRVVNDSMIALLGKFTGLWMTTWLHCWGSSPGSSLGMLWYCVLRQHGHCELLFACTNKTQYSFIFKLLPSEKSTEDIWCQAHSPTHSQDEKDKTWGNAIACADIGDLPQLQAMPQSSCGMPMP